MNKLIFIILFFCSLNAWSMSDKTLEKLSKSVHSDLQQALNDLAALRKQIAAEKIPLSQQIREREAEILRLRKDLDEFRKIEDSKSVDLQFLRDDLKSQEDAIFAINRTLSNYTEVYNESVRVFEIDQYPRHLADSDAPIKLRIETQTRVLTQGVDRLLAGSRLSFYDGKAIVGNEPLTQGKFLRAADNVWFLNQKEDDYSIAIDEVSGLTKTIAQGSLGTLEHILTGHVKISLPLDVTSGKALLLQSESGSVFAEIHNGGFWVYPILALGLLSLVIALAKAFELSKMGRVDRKAMDRLMVIAASHQSSPLQTTREIQTTRENKSAIHQFVTESLKRTHNAREQMEDFLLELMHRAKTKQEKHLYLIAVTASVAPLVGLLGTVAGMIETFKMISLFGSSDAMSLSSGISKALITTELGLIVAIPALVMHVLLTKRSQAIMSDMEYYAARMTENKFGYTNE